MANSMLEHSLEAHQSSDQWLFYSSHHSISNDQHVENRVAIGVLHIRIGTTLDQEIIDLRMTEGRSERQGVFTVVSMTYGTSTENFEYLCKVMNRCGFTLGMFRLWIELFRRGWIALEKCPSAFSSSFVGFIFHAFLSRRIEITRDTFVHINSVLNQQFHGFDIIVNDGDVQWRLSWTSKTVGTSARAESSDLPMTLNRSEVSIFAGAFATVGFLLLGSWWLFPPFFSECTGRGGWTMSDCRWRSWLLTAAGRPKASRRAAFGIRMAFIEWSELLRTTTRTIKSNQQASRRVPYGFARSLFSFSDDRKWLVKDDDRRIGGRKVDESFERAREK